MITKDDKFPKFWRWFLRSITGAYNGFPSLGDLEEEFNDQLESRGFRGARHWYRNQVFKSIPACIRHHIYWRFAMSWNYLKIMIRNIRFSKGYTFINICGLSIGLTAFLLILLFVRDELAYDRFHERGHRIGRVILHRNQNGEDEKYAITYDPLGKALTADIPEIEEAACFNFMGGGIIRVGDKLMSEGPFAFTDPSFFRMFSFHFIKGDPNTALDKPNAVVLSQDMAEKCFGDEDPMGKTIHLKSKPSLEVTGIIERPKRSHIVFDFVILQSKFGVL